ncbi:MAG: hypothetical protein ACJ79Y_17605, partial [Myxococcales bacterium]
MRGGFRSAQGLAGTGIFEPLLLPAPRARSLERLGTLPEDRRGALQRFPEIVEPLRDGRLCITTIVPLAKVLTPENRGEMLPRFFHRSKKEAMEVVATVQPATVAPPREVVTALPAASSARAEPIEAAPGSSAAAQLVQPVEPILFA